MSGGIAYSSDFLTIQFQNITAFGGKAITGGAMTLSSGEVLVISEGVFISNEAQSSGGALYLLNIDAMRMSSLNFSENKANLDGGAIAIYGSVQLELSDEETHQMRLTIGNSSFHSNSVQRRGGAFYGNNIFEANVSKCEFVGNNAAFGGALSTSRSTGNISYSQFFYNTALSGGGGVYWLYEVDGPIVSFLRRSFLILFKLTVDPSCISEGNSAIYGPFKATDVYRLTASRNVDSEENSGLW